MVFNFTVRYSNCGNWSIHRSVRFRHPTMSLFSLVGSCTLLTDVFHCQCLLWETHSDPSTFPSSEVIRQVAAGSGLSPPKSALICAPFPCPIISSSNLVFSIYTGRPQIPGNLAGAIWNQFFNQFFSVLLFSPTFWCPSTFVGFAIKLNISTSIHPKAQPS